MRRPDVFTLDYSHPLAQGLVTAWMGRFPGVQRSFDEITGAAAAVVGSAVWGDVSGRNGVYSKAAGAAIIVPRPSVNSADTHTISWCINAIGSSYNTSYAAYGRHFEDADLSFNFYNTLGNQFQFKVFGISASVPLSDSIYYIPTFFSIVSRPDRALLYKNGSLVNSTAGTKASSVATNTYLLNRSDLARTCNAGIADFLIHKRELSESEIALLADRTDPMLGGLVREANPVAYFDFGASEPTDITGTLSVTESGSDSIAATGQLLISGFMSVTETGVDAASILGALPVQGTLSAVETGTDTATASGAVLIQGNLSATETGTDTFAAYGGAVSPITGTMAVTETDHDTATIIGQLLVSGLMDVSEVGDDVFAAIGSALPSITGDMAATESGADAFAASGTVTDTAPITAAEVARIVRATSRMKTVTASARVKQVRYEIA